MNSILLAVTLILAPSADPPLSDAIKKDMAALDGEWTMVSGVMDGKPMDAKTVRTAKRSCENGETSVRINNQLFMMAKFTIDPGKTPKAIDYKVTSGANKGKTQYGIYEFDGPDTVKFSFALPGKDRPTDFSCKEKSGETLGIWKRVKKEEK